MITLELGNLDAQIVFDALNDAVELELGCKEPLTEAEQSELNVYVTRVRAIQARIAPRNIVEPQ